MTMLTKLVPFCLLALVGSACRTPPVGIETGPDGRFLAVLSESGREIRVEGHDGRLLVDGVDRGPIGQGSWVTVAWDGVVRVDGEVR
ncbi:MAG: hypothetical protein JNM25_04695 [Planctomycetes bacterium]|nr:hypothetical protein [Planctomycetota bacterium]